MKHYSLTQTIIGTDGRVTAVSQNRDSLGRFTAAKVYSSGLGSILNFMTSTVSDSTVLVTHNVRAGAQTVSAVSSRKSRVVLFANLGDTTSNHTVIL